jgi:hypothetical protein
MAIVGMRIKVALSTMIQIKPFHCHLICKCFLFFPAGLGPPTQDRPDWLARLFSTPRRANKDFADNQKLPLSVEGRYHKDLEHLRKTTVLRYTYDALQLPHENLQAWTRGRDSDLRGGASLRWVFILHWRRPGMTFIWTQVLSTSPPTFMHHLFAIQLQPFS